MDHDSLKAEILKVNQAFYERVYEDAWMSKIFRNVPKEIIISQQTDFMLGALGGPKLYQGRTPGDAHPHIFVDQEIWELREKYLKEAFVEVKFPKEMAEKWLRIDEAFKSKIIKASPDDCKKRFTTDEIIFESNPNKRKAS